MQYHKVNDSLRYYYKNGIFFQQFLCACGTWFEKDSQQQKYCRQDDCNRKRRQLEGIARRSKFTLSRKDRRQLRMERYCAQDGHCAICEKPTPFALCHLDHWIPLALGGEDSVDNLPFVICRRCNSIKGGRHPDGIDPAEYK